MLSPHELDYNTDQNSKINGLDFEEQTNEDLKSNICLSCIEFSHQIETLKSQNKDMEETKVLIMNELKALKSNEEIFQDEISKVKLANFHLLSKLETITEYLKENEKSSNNQNKELDSLNTLVASIQTSSESATTKLKEIHLEVEGCIKSIDTITTKQDTFDTDLSKIITVTETFMDRNTQLNRIKAAIIHSNEFIWKIDNLSKKIEEAGLGIAISIDSETFLSHQNGYTLQLSLYPKLLESSHKGKDYEGTAFMGIYFRIVRGAHDAILRWPMRHSIHIGLRNLGQSATRYGEEFSLSTANKIDSVCFDRPLSAYNHICGSQKFIQLDELLDKSSDLVREDTLFVSCVVNILSVTENS